MNEPLDLDVIKNRDPDMWPGLDRRLLLAEVERLRGELARRDQQITAVRALHSEDLLGFAFPGHCGECQFLLPCPTIRALDGTA